MTTLAILRSSIMSHYGITITPFLNILAQDEDTLTHYLITQQQTIFTQIFAYQGRFTTRRSTQIQYNTICIHILLQSLLNEHRTRFLHIIATRMEKRI